MTQVSSNFETGVNGNTLSTGDAGSPTAFDAVTLPGGALTYDNTHVYGSLAAKLVTAQSTAQVMSQMAPPELPPEPGVA